MSFAHNRNRIFSAQLSPKVVRAMSSPREQGRAKNSANRIESLKDQVLSLWREEVRRDPEQAAQIHQLDDQELADHLPALTDKIIALLRDEPAPGLEED